MPPPVLPLDPPRFIVPPPPLGLPLEVLEVEHPTVAPAAIALRQTAITIINVCRRITTPSAGESVPVGAGLLT